MVGGRLVECSGTLTDVDWLFALLIFIHSFLVLFCERLVESMCLRLIPNHHPMIISLIYPMDARSLNYTQEVIR